MQNEKARRKIVALTFLIVALLSILILFLFYQVVSMVSLTSRKRKLEQEIAQLQQIMQTTDNEIERAQSAVWLEIKARELGLLKKGDK